MAGIARSISGTIRQIGLAVLVVLIASSCGPSFSWSGHWSGKRDLPLPKGGDPAILSTISKVELTLRDNGHFELLEGGVPKSGTFRTEGLKGYLTVTHFMDRPLADQGEAALKMNQEIVLTAQKDGTVLYDDPGGIVKETVKLSRSEATPPR